MTCDRSESIFLKLVRNQKLKLTKKEISHRLDVPLSTYRKWEEGVNRVPCWLWNSLKFLVYELALEQKKNEKIVDLWLKQLSKAGYSKNQTKKLALLFFETSKKISEKELLMKNNRKEKSSLKKLEAEIGTMVNFK